MVKSGRGRIINIGSDAARVGTSNEAVYSACMGGLISFIKSVASHDAGFITGQTFSVASGMNMI